MLNRKTSSALLLLGMVFLLIGIAADKEIFSWVAIVLVLVFLASGGRWRAFLGRRRK